MASWFDLEKASWSLSVLCTWTFLFAAVLSEKGALIGEISLVSLFGFGLHY